MYFLHLETISNEAAQPN